MQHTQLNLLDTDALRFETIENCPICGSIGCDPSFTIKKFGYKFIWNQCRNCGVAYQNPRLNKESLNQLYQSKNFWEGKELTDSSLKILGYEDYLSGEEMCLKNEMYKVKKICNTFINSGKLLDIACGSGTFMRAARRSGFDVQGIELSEVIAQYGRKQHNLDIVAGDFESFQCSENSFDLISLWNADNIFSLPQEAWKKIFAGLRSGGYFIFNFLDNRVLNRFFLNFIQVWRDCHSLYVHSKNSVRYLSEKTGFESCRFLNQYGFSRIDRILNFIGKLNYNRFARKQTAGHCPYHLNSPKSASLFGKCSRVVIFLPMIGYVWAVMKKE